MVIYVNLSYFINFKLSPFLQWLYLGKSRFHKTEKNKSAFKHLMSYMIMSIWQNNEYSWNYISHLYYAPTYPTVGPLAHLQINKNYVQNWYIVMYANHIVIKISKNPKRIKKKTNYVHLLEIFCENFWPESMSRDTYIPLQNLLVSLNLALSYHHEEKK